MMSPDIQNPGRRSSQRDKESRDNKRLFYFYSIIIGFLILSTIINVLNDHIFKEPPQSIAQIQIEKYFKKGFKNFNANNAVTTVDGGIRSNSNPKSIKKEHVVVEEADDKDEFKPEDSDVHKLGGLTCEKYGGPSDEIASQMVYWSDIPSDSLYVSPFKKNDQVQYMTFEPDGGGWNNIRMAMETVVVLAHATGRTLVLPPDQKMYLLGKQHKNKQKTHFSFADFFHLDSLNLEHSGIDIISTEEFLTREALTGNMRNKTSGLVSYPPGNRTNWDGENNPKELKEWLREVTLTPLWKPGQCLAAFPSSPDAKEIDNLKKIHKEVRKENKQPPEFTDPVPVDADIKARMNEVLVRRDELCIYDEEMQSAPVVHFMCYHKMRVRLLVHFYAFIFFEDWKTQLWTNRFVRDHLRYIDELQCTAARVVEAIRDKARENGNADGEFDTFHVRRGDFQYKNTRVEASVLFEESKDLIPEGATLYIATDERKKEFFDPIKAHYKVYYLDDFKHLFEGLNTNYYGMLDQLIASQGRTFVGTFYSTFTGYINRMRGYHAEKRKLGGYESGIINSYYFVPQGKKFVMRKYAPLRGPFYAREFPTAWRDIDKDLTSSL